MNYLAHAYLSGDDHELMVGNFIADHVKGNKISLYAPGIVKGIQLHRRIDSFADGHPAFRESKRFFYKDFEKYSGILVDIYFDHFLAAGFSNYSEKGLRVFSAEIYKVYLAYKAVFPASGNRFLDYVVKNNIYLSYATVKGIETVLHHLSHRIRHGVRLEQSLPVFLEHRAALNNLFTGFFSELVIALKDEY